MLVFNRNSLKYVHYPSFVKPSLVPNIETDLPLHSSHTKSQQLISKTPTTYQEFKKSLKYNDINNAWEIYNHLVPSPSFKKVELLLHPEEHSTMLHQLVLHVHTRIAAYRSFRVYTRMKEYNIPIDRRDYHALLLVTVRNNDVERASKIFEQVVSNYSLDSRSASLMLSLYGNQNDSIKIYEIWDMIKTIPGALDNPDVWAIGIDTFGKAGYFDTSLELFNQYKDHVNNLKPKGTGTFNFKLDRKPFEAMIRAYGVRGYLDSAKELFLELENGKNMLDLESFDAIIHACKSCHNFEEGEAYWNKLLNFIHGRANKSLIVWRPIPLQSTICTMMSFYAEKKNSDTVLELYQKYRQYMPESLELLEIITWTLLHVGKHSEAIEVYDRLRLKHYIPSDILSSTIEHFRMK